MPATLADWLTYLESLHPKTIALGLERVAQVRQQLDLKPGFPLIAVGGTNGKGSVCALLESMLHAAGYRVGCYTSPHLLDYNERVRIAKKQASDAELCASFEAIELARGDIPLTYFEFGTLAAMQCFIAHRVEVAILEVGLGGRLDAVNVFDADCAVVSSVGIDHTEYLGETREQIAFEKAGIFRRGKVALFGDADMPATIASEAQRIGAVLWRSGHEYWSAGDGQWDFHGVIGTRNALPLPALRGACQLNNASTALAALDALKDELPVEMQAVRRGLVEVELPGRFQVLPGRPQIILDVAHNPQAAQVLAQNLAGMPPCPRTIAVFAMLKDKDVAGVVRALKGSVDIWLVAGIDAARGASAGDLTAVLRAEAVEGDSLAFSSVQQALLHACNMAAENDRILVFGSFFTVADVMRVRGLHLA